VLVVEMKENEELVGNILVGVEDWLVVRHVDEYLDPFKRYRLLMSHYFINTTVYILIDNLLILNIDSSVVLSVSSY